MAISRGRRGRRKDLYLVTSTLPIISKMISRRAIALSGDCGGRRKMLEQTDTDSLHLFIFHRVNFYLFLSHWYFKITFIITVNLVISVFTSP